MELSRQSGNVLLRKGDPFPPAGDYDNERCVHLRLAPRLAWIAQDALRRSGKLPSNVRELVSLYAAVLKSVVEPLHPDGRAIFPGSEVQRPLGGDAEAARLHRDLLERIPDLRSARGRTRSLVVCLTDYRVLESAGEVPANCPLQRGLHDLMSSRNRDVEFFWDGETKVHRISGDANLELGRDFLLSDVGPWTTAEGLAQGPA